MAGRKAGRPIRALVLASAFLAFLRLRLNALIARRSAGVLSGPWSAEAEALARGTGPWSLASALIAGSWSLVLRGTGRWSPDELLDPENMSLVPRAKWLRLTNNGF